MIRSAVAHRVAQLVHGQVLLGVEDPAGNADAHHADMVDVEALALPLGADVAIVLLVDPVELE